METGFLLFACDFSVLSLLWGNNRSRLGKSASANLSKNYWFASVYMGFVLLLPFAGMLVVRLTKKQYQYLLFILTIFFSVNHMIFRVDTYGIFSGRELSWFCYLALLAGYIKLHTRQDKKYFLYGLFILHRLLWHLQVSICQSRCIRKI